MTKLQAFDPAVKCGTWFPIPPDMSRETADFLIRDSVDPFIPPEYRHCVEFIYCPAGPGKKDPLGQNGPGIEIDDDCATIGWKYSPAAP